MAPLQFSVVIPTYQRREVILKAVASLAQQEFSGSFEVLVVVDGSEDGSAEALRELGTPFPLTILEQPNHGAATARNHGAAHARGEILLFLDDDMISHPSLLAEHDRSHRQGADVVLGQLPLHPESPVSILTFAVRDWADQRTHRLSAPDAKLTLHDLLTGQLSIARETFKTVGGFDTSFTFGGSFGNEDIDFGYRLTLAGCKIVFNPKAISWQYYVVTPRRYLQQWRQAGAADVAFARKHPEQTDTIFALNGADQWPKPHGWRRIVSWPYLGRRLISLWRAFLLAQVEKGSRGKYIERSFHQLRKAEYWQGVQENGGIPRPQPLRILAYHAIADLSGLPILEEFGVPPHVFRQQVEWLLRHGFHFVTAAEVIRFLQGTGGLPRKAILLTFDDCYADLLECALPILKEFRIPAVAFAVSGCLGGYNEWDRKFGAGQRRLLDARGLFTLANAGIEIGAHSRNHRSLPQLHGNELAAEIDGSISDLERIGLKRPYLFAYPYGESNSKVREAAQAAGLKAAFTVNPGTVQPGQDPFDIPRIEILRSDTLWNFWRKVVIAGS